MGRLSERLVTAHGYTVRCRGPIVDSIVLGQAAGVEHVSFYSRTELLISPYNEP